MKTLLSKRIQSLPPYPFAELDRKKVALRQQGKDLIDLSIGDPDIPTPAPIVTALQQAASRAEHHRYPPYAGTLAFREAVIRWYQKRFGVSLTLEETLTLIGSKEGIANIHYAFVNPGDCVLCPTPGYPVYATATQFAGGEPYFMGLTRENHFLPDLKAIPASILKRTQLMHLNYPNNPTSATATENFFKEVVAFAKQHDIIVCHDAPYTEIYFDGKQPLSFLQTPGAKEVGIEFHSLSKTFNMTGWRLGMAVGQAAVISGLAKIKTNVDSGAFGAVQEAGVFALDHTPPLTPPLRTEWQSRRDAFAGALKKQGFEIQLPEATFYLWMQVPKGDTSESFASKLLEQCSVVVTPGTAFGQEAGKGYIRFALTAPQERLLEAAERIGLLG